MPFCFISRSLPLDIQGDIFMKKAKQMIWLHCWRRAASVSKHCKPLSHDKSSQPRDVSMPGFWACSPKNSFLLLMGTQQAPSIPQPLPSALVPPDLTCLPTVPSNWGGQVPSPPAYSPHRFQIFTFTYFVPLLRTLTSLRNGRTNGGI